MTFNDHKLLNCKKNKGKKKKTKHIIKELMKEFLSDEKTTHLGLIGEKHLNEKVSIQFFFNIENAIYFCDVH